MRRQGQRGIRTEVTPGFAIVSVHVDNGSEKLERLVKRLAPLEEHADGVEGGNRLRIREKRALISMQRVVGDAQQF